MGGGDSESGKQGEEEGGRLRILSREGKAERAKAGRRGGRKVEGG